VKPDDAPLPDEGGVVRLTNSGAAVNLRFHRVQPARRRHEAGETQRLTPMAETMNKDKLPATDSAPAGAVAERTMRPSGSGTAAQAETASRRAVGVYDRPAQRAGLSRPLLVLIILAALVSLVMTARFLF
jgi:hypothetical protein